MSLSQGDICDVSYNGISLLQKTSRCILGVFQIDGKNYHKIYSISVQNHHRGTTGQLQVYTRAPSDVFPSPRGASIHLRSLLLY